MNVSLVAINHGVKIMKELPEQQSLKRTGCKESESDDRIEDEINDKRTSTTGELH